jgi:general secretion pathway protein J
VLRNVLHTQRATEEAATSLQQIQQAIFYLERDLLQIVARPIRDEYGTEVEALKGDEFGEYRLQLTHTGRANPNWVERSFLERVAYAMPEDEEQKLYRYSWPVLDRTDNEPRKLLLLDNVEELIIQYFDNENKASTSWPNLLSSSTAVPGLLPHAIEINLTLKGYGKFRRFIVLPKGGLS